MPPRQKASKAKKNTPGIRPFLSRATKPDLSAENQMSKTVSKMAAISADGDGQSQTVAKNVETSDSAAATNNGAKVREDKDSPGQLNSDAEEGTGTDSKVVSDNSLEKMEQRLMAAIAGLGTNVESLKTQLEGGLQGIEQSLEYAHKEITDLKETVTRVETESKKLTERLDVAEKKLEKLNITNREKHNDLERHSRGFSIRVRNVPNVKTSDDYRVVVAKILVENQLIDETPEDVFQEIEHAHPIGEPRDGKSTLIARLYSRPVRSGILAKARRMKYVEGKLRVVEDMTKLDYQRRQAAYPLMKKAIEDGKKAVFRRGKLIINSKEVPVVIPSKSS